MTIDLKAIIKRYLIPLIATVICTTILSFLINGIPIFGIPKTADIIEAEVSRDGVVRTVVEKEDLEIAYNLVRSLSHKLGSCEDEQLIISIEFKLEDGSSVKYGAGENAVFVDGKLFKVHNSKAERFIKLAEAIFFHRDLINQKTVS